MITPADLVVIVPSRGRPQQLRDLIDAVDKTASGAVRVLPCLDSDDPALLEYRKLLPPAPRMVSTRRSLSAWTNRAARTVLDAPDPPSYLASLGDDHRPRTPGWDQRLIAVIESLGAPGIAYGNDLLQGASMPTAWVVSADIVRALGWMMLPACEHMYVDAAVLELGRAIDRIVYCPDVVIEHVHPLAGKADWDESYRESNHAERYAADRAAFEAWKRDGQAADIEKLLAVRAGV